MTDPTLMQEALEVICGPGVPESHLTPYGCVRAIAAFALGKTEDAFYRDGERLLSEARALSPTTPEDERSKEMTAPQSSVSKTSDLPTSVLLRIQRDSDGYLVTDTVGIRYGWGLDLVAAVKFWAECVLDLCEEPAEKQGGALKAEAARYRQALQHQDTASSGGLPKPAVSPEEKK